MDPFGYGKRPYHPNSVFQNRAYKAVRRLTVGTRTTEAQKSPDIPKPLPLGLSVISIMALLFEVLHLKPHHFPLPHMPE